MKRLKWMPERGSQRVLFAIIAVTAVVFALFYLVGFNHPFPDDPDFNEPRLTDVLLWLMAGVRGRNGGCLGRRVPFRILTGGGSQRKAIR